MGLAPVPSPVPSRPDTADDRTVFDCPDCGRARIAAGHVCFGRPADAHPVTDQGPDLSELRAARNDAFNRWIDFEMAWQRHDWPATNETTDAAQELAGAMGRLFAALPELAGAMGRLFAALPADREGGTQ